MSLPRPCLTCGTLSPASHCPEHVPHPPDLRRGRDRSTVGRGAAWVRLSKRARATQDFCGDCGSRSDLTADHLPSAWHKFLTTRQPVTLLDVEVVCRSCNSKRGPAIPGSKRYADWLAEQGGTRGASPARQGATARRFRGSASYFEVGTA